MTDSLLNDKEEITIDPAKNYLEELVGPGRKFKDPEELAKGKYFADQTIELYKQRMDQQRQDYLALQAENNAQANLRELIDQINQNKSNSDNTPHANDNKPAFDPEQLDSLLEQKITKREAEKLAQANLDTVRNKLQEQFGDNYKTILKQRSAEMGLTEEDIDALARRSPKAFIKALDLEPKKQETFEAPPRSQWRNDNFAPTGKKARTWAYYQELKKTNPQAYYDPKIGVQMAKDAVDLGEAFRDGDYYRKGLHEPN